MPQRLGRYAVRRRIGSGGFATVWLAYDEQLDAPVAVKVLADNWSEDHQVRSRFIEEGRYLRRVESPHVVSVYDAGELDDGRPYLVMSYADQGTLADRLELSGMTLTQGLEVVRQVAAGLQALHDRGILHRDVKPANVLFRTVDGGPTLRAMLGDLGLGKALDASSRLTMIAGTPSFVAPEQAQGESPDARADQYSLGVLTFLLLGGRTPWTHASLGSAADPAPPPPLSTGGLVFPAPVEEAVRRALAREPDERWPSVTDFVTALTAALADATLIEVGGPGGSPGAADALGGDPGAGWLSVDPDLTVPGARPTELPRVGPPPTSRDPDTADPSGPHPSGPDLGSDRPDPRRTRPWRRPAAALACLVVLGAAGAGGYAAAAALAPEASTTPITVEDETGTLSVTVPPTWRAEATSPWRPPNATDQDFAALSVGTSPTWSDPDAGPADGDDSAGEADAPAEGVFVGVLPGNALPAELPQHRECDTAAMGVRSEVEGDPAATQIFTGCRDGTVTVERVVQIATGQLLWVQIRGSDQAAAIKVLDTVRVNGV